MGAGGLVGRNNEIAAVADALEDAASGQGRLIVVAGEPGIGKTALLDAAVDLAEPRQVVTLRVKSISIDSDRPFGMVRALLEGGPDGPERRSLDALLMPAEGASIGWVENPETRFRAVDLFVAALERIARSGPLLLLIDDAQWADDTSLVALKSLTSRFGEIPAAVLIACRPGGHSRPLREVLETADVLVELTALQSEAVTEMARRCLGVEPAPGLSAQLQRADGNPFFVRALTDAWMDDKAEEQEARETVQLPRTLTDAVAAQLDCLDDASRHMLRVLAIVGRPLSVDLISAITESPLQGTALSVESAVKARLLDDKSGVVGFRHDLVRESILATVAPAVQRALHLHIGRTLLARSWSPVEVAGHFIAGAELGDLGAVLVLRTAAEELARVAPAAATRLLERAAAVLPDTHRDRVPVLAELAQSYVFSADLERGMALTQDLLARGLAPDVELGLRNARSQVFFLRGRAREAAHEFVRMAPLMSGSQRESVVLADAAVSSMFAMELDSAAALASTSLEVATRTGDRTGPVLAHGVRGWLQCLGGDIAGGLLETDQALRIADEHEGLEGHRRIPHLFHAQALLWADRVEEAHRCLGRGRELSESLGMGWDEPMYHALAAIEQSRSGEWDDALAEIDAGLDRAAKVGSYFADGWLHAHRALITLERGQTDVAMASLAAGDSALEQGGSQGADLLWWVRARALALRGDSTGALASLRELWRAYDHFGAKLRQAEMAPDLVRLAIAEGDGELARMAVAALAAGPMSNTGLGRSMMEWCVGLADGDAGALRHAAGLLAARDAPADAARCRLDLLKVATNDEASELAKQVLADMAWLGTDPPPEVRGLLPSPLSTPHPPRDPWDRLTRSERRVVERVATGMTNTEIATDLSISRRTVESHLYRAYPKLGVTTRVELTLTVLETQRTRDTTA